MDLSQLLNQGRLRRHKTSKSEISELLQLVKRDIQDSRVKGLSPDRRFAIAYNAVLQLATIFLYCKGYRSDGIGHHATVFKAMKERHYPDEAPVYTKQLPLEDILGNDGIYLAHTVNGQTLPVEHGYPLRLVAKGIYGSYWVKWLEVIEVR